MDVNEKKLLETFEARVNHLIFLHDELKAQNARLRSELLEKEEQLTKVTDKYNEVHRNYANLKTAKTISLNDNEVKQTKQRLSKLVREIDKCIELLNT